MKTPEHSSKDIFVKSAGGVADAAAQDEFCANSTCIVQRIYDQSPMQNHLGIEHGAPNLNPPRNIQDLGVNFTDARSKATLGGHPVYAAVFEGDTRGSGHPFSGQGYSNRTARGTAVGDEPQSMYAVFSGQHLGSGGCCFDYGNAENVTNGKAGPMFDGSMEAIYWQGGTIGADLENGIYGSPPTQPTASNFLAGFLKGKPGNHYSVKSGDPQKAGSLTVAYDGKRPGGYEVMKKQGGIILGIGGDNSPWGAGVFYEGVMTAGYSSDETDTAVMANIVAAGYGSA
jgi:hypothetical protein